MRGGVRLPPVRHEEDYEMMVAAARLHYERGWQQTKVAKQLQVSQSTVSRLLDRARQEGIIRVHIEVPPMIRDREALELRYGNRGVRKFYLVPGGVGGSGKNITNLSGGGARVLLQAIRQVPGSVVRIGMSCGATLRAVIDGFFQLLEEEPEIVEELSYKELHVYPLALYEDTDLNRDYPHSVVYKFAMRAAEEYRHRLHIIPHLITIDKTISGVIGPKEKDELKRNVINKAKDADIFLLGIGITDSNYQVIYKDIADFPFEQNEYFGECNHIPFDGNGVQDGTFARKTFALNIDDFRAIVNNPEDRRSVIAVAGGRLKKQAIRAALVRPFCNVLVTDSEIAQYLLSNSDINSSPRETEAGEVASHVTDL